MLVRRAGLGENFFYNNAIESKHKRMKDRKKKLYGDRKLAWTQTVDLVKAISEEEERNSERAIVDEGPYRIRGLFTSRLQVPFHSYIAKSHAEKERINKKIHSLSLEELQAQNLMKASNKRRSKQNGKSLTECAYINIPKSVGRKPGEAERRRQRSGQVVQRSTEGYRERLQTVAKPQLDTTTFKVKWLKGSRVYRCYGCRKNIRPKPMKGEDEIVPPPPWDFVLARLELRQIPDPTGGLRMSIKPEPVHYHPKLACIRKAHGQRFYPKVEVTASDREAMDGLHHNHLRNEFGL